MLAYRLIFRFRRGLQNAGRNEFGCNAITQTKPLADDIDALLADQRRRTDCVHIADRSPGGPVLGQNRFSQMKM